MGSQYDTFDYFVSDSSGIVTSCIPRVVAARNSFLNGRTFIYGLMEPETNMVRYVGKANNPKQRLAEHHQSTRLIKQKNCHRRNWLLSLIERGTKAKLIILEEVSIEEWENKEKEWISKFPDLTNSNKGGGGTTYSPKEISQETREKISQSVKRYVNSPEGKAKCSKGGKLTQGKPKGKSRFCGVHKMHETRFISYISFNLKRIHIGSFRTEIEAATSYDKKAIELYGENCILNFPENREKYLNKTI